MITWAVRLLDDRSDITQTVSERGPPDWVLAALSLSSAVRRKLPDKHWTLASDPQIMAGLDMQGCRVGQVANA